MASLQKAWRGSRCLVVLSCLPLLGGCDGFFKGNGVLSYRLNQLIGADTDPTSVVRAGIVAIGDSMAAELSVNLMAAGLTEAQALVIADGARSEVATAAGTVVLGLGLDDTTVKPLAVAASPVVSGAMKTLDNDLVGLTDAAAREAIARVIMSSTFSSLGSRIADFGDDELMSLQGKMVGAAVTSLNEGGLGGDAAESAMTAVTAGAVEALASSGNADTAAAAAAVAAGAIAQINNAGLPADKLESIAGAAANGVVGSLLSGGISTGALAAAVQKVTAASVGALTGAAVAGDKIGAYAGSIASGAIGGLTATGVSSQNLINGGVIEAALGGTVGGLAKSGLSESQTSVAVGTITTQAVTKLSTSTVSSGNRETAVEQIVKGSIGAASAAGLTSGGFLGIAMGNIVGGAVASLTNAGIAAANVANAAKAIAASGIAKIAAVGVTSLDTATSLSSKIAEGAAQACMQLAQKGAISADVAKSAAVGVISGSTTLAVQAFTTAGLITNAAGTTQLQSAVASGGFTGLAVSGVATSTITAVKTTVVAAAPASLQSTYSGLADAAVTLSNQITTGSLPVCHTTYGSSVTTTAFFAAIKDLATPIYCARATAAEACPAARESSTKNANWVDKGGTQRLCELVLTTPKTSTTTTTTTLKLPSCAVLGALTTAAELYVYFDPGYGGAACARVGSACPAVASALVPNFTWESQKTLAANDTCVLRPVETASADDGFPQAVTCASIGATNGFGTLALATMTKHAGSPGAHACEVPMAASCPIARPGLSHHGISLYEYPLPARSMRRCTYWTNLDTCREALQGASTLSATGVGTMRPVNSWGGGACLTEDASCPALASAAQATFELTNAFDPYDQVRRCDYERTVRSCSYTGGEVNINAADFGTGFDRVNDRFRVCSIPAGITISSGSLHVDQELKDAAYIPSIDYASHRLIVSTSVPSCGGLNLGTNVEEHELMSLGGLPNSYDYSSNGEPESPDIRACDVPAASSCPAKNTALSGWTTDSRTFSGLGVKRCYYQRNLPNCAAIIGDLANPITAANLTSFASFKDGFGPYASACKVTIAETCPSVESPLYAAYPRLDRQPTGTSLRHCIYKHAMIPCNVAGVTAGINESNLYSLSYLQPDLQGCSVNNASCPTVSAPLLQKLQLIPQPYGGTPLTRCVLKPKRIACSTLPNFDKLDATTVANWAPDATPDGAVSFSCDSSSSYCTTPDPALGGLDENSLDYYSSPSGLSGRLCRYNAVMPACPTGPVGAAALLPLPTRHNWAPGVRFCGVSSDSACPALAAGAQGEFDVVKTPLNGNIHQCAFTAAAPSCGSSYSTYGDLLALPLVDGQRICDVPTGTSCPYGTGALSYLGSSARPVSATVTRCSFAEPDAPLPGDNGTLQLTNVQPNSVQLSWVQANDSEDAPAELAYDVFVASSSILVNAPTHVIRGNGTLASGTATAPLTLNNLDPNLGYSFNVIVRDTDGHESAYTGIWVAPRNGGGGGGGGTCNEVSSPIVAGAFPTTSFAVTSNNLIIIKSDFQQAGSVVSYNIANPANIYPVGSELPLNGLNQDSTEVLNPAGLYLSSNPNYAFVRSDVGVTFLNIGNGSTPPIPVGINPTKVLPGGPGLPVDLATCGTNLFVATLNYGITRFELSNPEMPAMAGFDLVGGAAPNSYPKGVACSGGIGYLGDSGAGGEHGLRPFTAALSPLTRNDSYQLGSGWAPNGSSVLYMMANGNDIAVFNTTNPNAIPAATILPGKGHSDGRISGNATEMIVTSGAGGFEVFRHVDTPTNPTSLFKFTPTGGQTVLDARMVPGRPFIIYSTNDGTVTTYHMCERQGF